MSTHALLHKETFVARHLKPGWYKSTDADYVCVPIGGSVAELHLGHPATVTGGLSETVTITEAGEGYSSAPAVRAPAPSQAKGQRARYEATVENGAVTAITRTRAGSGYVSTDAPFTLTLSGGGTPTTAAAAKVSLDVTNDSVVLASTRPKAHADADTVRYRKGALYERAYGNLILRYHPHLVDLYGDGNAREVYKRMLAKWKAAFEEDSFYLDANALAALEAISRYTPSWVFGILYVQDFWNSGFEIGTTTDDRPLGDANRKLFTLTDKGRPSYINLVNGDPAQVKAGWATNDSRQTLWEDPRS